MHLTSSPVDWYAARAGGVVAYLLLTASVLLGLTMSSRERWENWPRVAIEDVHRFAGLLTGSFIAIHVVTIAIDSYLPFSLSSIVVPFTSSYRPAWVGLGIIAAEMLAALAVTNRLRNRRVSYRTWRRAHYLNFAVWGAATLHGIGSGTDRSTPWLVLLMGVSTAMVLAMTLRRTKVADASAAGVLGAAAATGVVLLTAGPVRFNARPWNAASFSDDLEGQIVRQAGETRGIISLAGTGSGEQRVLVRADLLTAPDRLVSTSFQMEYLPSGATCRGSVTQVDPDGLGFAARCRTDDGESRSVAARWLEGEGPDLEGGTIVSNS